MDAVLVSIRDKADDLAAFGWVQAPQYDSAVVGGEFRGNKNTVGVMQQFLTGLASQGYACVTETYTDTKIRDLFSHFKIMDPSRRMCFEERPYRCPASGSASGGRQEL